MRHILSTVQEALRPRYLVKSEVGRGSVAVVFTAWDTERERNIAIKVLRPEFGATIVAQRFHREMGYLADLDHPNILSILDSGEANNLTFFTMPYAHGDTLGARIKEGRGQLPIDEAVSITREIAGAIDHAHARNIIHRDIKPDNIVFVRSRAMVCDFGVARALVTAGRERLSSSGLIVGTPEFMSPEQASGEWDLSGAADIYALGCLVYTMLAGEPPFTGPTAQAVMSKHVRASVPAIRVVRPEVPEQMEQVLIRTLAKNPEERPRNARELAAEMGG